MNIVNDKNVKVLNFLEGENKVPPTFFTPDNISVDPYWELDSHPEVVERLWDQINKELPADSRIIICGIPSLANPDTGVILAIAIGTEYAIRLPNISTIELALELGAYTKVEWSDEGNMDIRFDLGDDWVFGAWLEMESNWVKQSYLKSGT